MKISPPVVFASVHEGMRGPQFNDFAVDLADLDATFYATGGTARDLEALGIETHPATDLIKVPGLAADRLPRPVVAGLVGGLIAAGETEIDLVVAGIRPPTFNPAETDFGGPAYILAAAKAGIPTVTLPSQHRPVKNWLRSGRPDNDNMVRWLNGEAHETAAIYHREAQDHLFVDRRPIY